MKRNISKLAAMFLTAAIAVVPVASSAEGMETTDVVVEATEVTTTETMAQSKFIENKGKVLEITDLETGKEALVQVEEIQYRVKLPETLLVVNAGMGSLGLTTDIKVDDEINFYTTEKTVMTLSIPAILTPEFIIMNYEENGQYVGMLDETLMNDTKDLQFVIDDNTNIIPQNGTKIALSSQDLVGKYVIALYTVITTSDYDYLQTNPEVVILLNDDVVVEETTETTIPSYVTADGVTMIGFSASAMAKGYEVSWDATTFVAEAKKGEDVVTVSIGEGTIKMAGKEEAMTSDMVTVEGRLYLPETAYNDLFLA